MLDPTITATNYRMRAQEFRIHASGSTSAIIRAIYQRLVETFERLAISADHIAIALVPENDSRRQFEEQTSPPVDPKSSKPVRKKLVLKVPPPLRELPLASSAKDDPIAQRDCEAFSTRHEKAPPERG